MIAQADQPLAQPILGFGVRQPRRRLFSGMQPRRKFFQAIMPRYFFDQIHFARDVLPPGGLAATPCRERRIRGAARFIHASWGKTQRAENCLDLCIRHAGSHHAQQFFA